MELDRKRTNIYLSTRKIKGALGYFFPPFRFFLLGGVLSVLIDEKEEKIKIFLKEIST